MATPISQQNEQSRCSAKWRTPNPGIAAAPSGPRDAESRAEEALGHRVRRHCRIIAALPSLLWFLAAIAVLLDRAFPPDLSRLASVGTEIVDRRHRPLA